MKDEPKEQISNCTRNNFKLSNQKKKATEKENKAYKVQYMEN
jgi:hypothetical protein